MASVRPTGWETSIARLEHGINESDLAALSPTEAMIRRAIEHSVDYYSIFRSGRAGDAMRFLPHDGFASECQINFDNSAMRFVFAVSSHPSQLDEWQIISAAIE